MIIEILLHPSNGYLLRKLNERFIIDKFSFSLINLLKNGKTITIVAPRLIQYFLNRKWFRYNHVTDCSSFFNNENFFTHFPPKSQLWSLYQMSERWSNTPYTYTDGEQCSERKLFSIYPDKMTFLKSDKNFISSPWAARYSSCSLNVCVIKCVNEDLNNIAV